MSKIHHFKGFSIVDGDMKIKLNMSRFSMQFQEAQYLLDGKVIGKTDIVAAKSVKKAGLWDYIKHIRKRMIKGDDYSADR